MPALSFERVATCSVLSLKAPMLAMVSLPMQIAAHVCRAFCCAQFAQIAVARKSPPRFNAVFWLGISIRKSRYNGMCAGVWEGERARQTRLKRRA